MATTLTVERIDIIEGPNLKVLLSAFTDVETGVVFDTRVVRFEYVSYFDEHCHQLQEYGSILLAQLIGLRYLANDPRSGQSHDFVITVMLGGLTLEGHYNTHSRKGSLSALT